ncbi:hypothetical protein [Mesorhizobium sp. RMAD-H1]|uniref:hypothetical protein n=1 Tax=Mesorhizobium sp. RMAD-H1 TaxID=2587065 RepID=UPI0018102AB3|nr:hypothetical protein [Mesorhizobium sp. RMAD-H1]MBB2974150.1 hypothetical protein [Mesorhizobium sp. RMAD-H1]
MNSTKPRLAAGIPPAAGKNRTVPVTAAYWLSLAATPTFAGMALLTGLPGGDMPDMLCSAGHGSSALAGMSVMYALMSVFHLSPWLKLISGR